MFTHPSTHRLSTGCLLPHNQRVPQKSHPSFVRLMVFVRAHRMDAIGPFGDGEFEPAVRQHLGVSAGRFTNWKTRGISQEGALLAQKKFGCSANWVLTGIGDEMSSAQINEPPNVEPGPELKGVYPLISFVEAGRWSQVYDNFQPGDAEEWVMSPHNLGQHGFVLRVKGQSMTAPEGSRFTFPEGMLLHVRAGADPVPGQFVIVRREAEAEATFKRYTLVDGQPFLEAINPDWPHRYLRLQEGDVFCGVVVGASFDNLP